MVKGLHPLPSPSRLTAQYMWLHEHFFQRSRKPRQGHTYVRVNAQRMEEESECDPALCP
jgi:hypothetical protein